MDRFPSTPRPATISLATTQPSYAMQAHNLRRQAVSGGAHAFGLNLTFPPLTRAEFGPVFGFLAKQDGRAGVFEYAPHTKQQPLGAGSAGAQEATNNQVKWSQRFDLSPWSYNATGYPTLGGSTPAPEGLDQAQLWEVAASSTEDWPYMVQSVGALSGSVAVSVYVKGASAARTGVTLRNATQNIHHLVTVTWSGGVPSVNSTDGPISSYGITSVGAGWYRIWMLLDLAANAENGDTFEVRIYPRVTQASVQAGTYVWGAQVSADATAVLDYLRTWGATRTRTAGPRFSAVTNLVEASENLGSAYWNKGGYVAPATGPEFKRLGVDPLGGNTAQSWGTPSGNGVYPGNLSAAAVTSAAASQYVLSCYVRKDQADRCAINLYEPNSTTSHWVHIDFDAAGVATLSSPSGVDGYGIEEVGDGWYRAWLMVDCESRGIVDVPLKVYLYPHQEDDGDPRAPEGTYMWGVQLEVGRVLPGHYLARSSVNSPSFAFDSGTVLHTEGWSPSQAGVLKAGDLVKVSGLAKVFVVTDDCDADAAGLGTVKVRPQLPAVVYPPTALQVEDIAFQVAQDGDVIEMPADGNDHTVFQLSLVEVV